MTALQRMPAALRSWLLARARDRLMRNIGWYGLAEVAVRLSRIVSAIVLARMLLPVDFGVAAAVLTSYELVRVLANNGSGLMIVNAPAAGVASAAVAAYRVSLAATVTMVVLQGLAGAVMASAMGRPEILGLCAVLALSHIFTPWTTVRYCLMLRANRLKALAGINAAQIIADTALMAVLALAGFGVWSVVLPRLLLGPLYVALIRRAEPWSPPAAVAPTSYRAVAAFSLPIVGTELIAALRVNLDKVLVAAMFGVETLGVYAFAYSAGLGLTLSVTTALTAALFPHLAEVAQDRAALLARFDATLKTTVAALCGLIAVQTAAVFVYVPVLFGERWAFATPLVALLCLSSVTRPLYDAACQLLRACGDTRLELLWSSLFTAVLLGVFGLALFHGLTVAIGVFSGASIFGHLLFIAAVRRHAARCPMPAEEVSP